MNDQGMKPIEIAAKLSAVDIDNDPNLKVKELLKRANMIKQQDQWHKSQREKERAYTEQKQKDLTAYWTASRFYNLMVQTSLQKYGKELILNDQTTPLIKAICYFFSRDPRFETELGYTFSKGLLIRGISGLGKTFIPLCVADNSYQPMKVLSMIEITDEVRSEGEYKVVMGDAKILYLDDVGTEETPIVHFGTKVNWFKEFIELYYAKKYPFSNLIISTNCGSEDIESLYGHRVRSRMREMVNVIDVKGEDLRA